MADLSIDVAGIRSPNPFWLASAPPANTGEHPASSRPIPAHCDP